MSENYFQGQDPGNIPGQPSEQPITNEPPVIPTKQQDVVSGQTPPVQVRFAGFWIRWVAALIDGMIIGAANFIISLPIAFILGGGLMGGEEEFNPIKLFFQFFGLLLTWSYHIFLNYRYGATLGKRLLGLTVYSTSSENLTLGQLVLRETVGKIASTIILFGGYIMAAFTERKQALHDMIGQTVVAYREPEKSNRKTIVVIVVVAIFGGIVVIGLLATIVLVSLNSAREKARDAQIKSSLFAEIPEAILYYEDNGSFSGFRSNITLPDCSEGPIVHVSEDGKVIAIYAKLCSKDDVYWCVDTDMEEVGPNGSNEVGNRDPRIPARCNGEKLESEKEDSIS